MEEFVDDVISICEAIAEECRKKERSREEIVKMFPFVSEQVIVTVLDFLCSVEILKEESGKYKITDFGRKFLELPPVEGGGDEFDAN